MTDGLRHAPLTQEADLTSIVQPEAILSVPENIGLGFQHVIAMFGSTVLGPLLMGFDPNVAVFFSGIATIVFYISLRGAIPSYLGSSFSFIAAVGAATAYSHHGPNPHIAVALGGIVVAGLIYLTIGLMAWKLGSKWLGRVFPGIVTGSIVAIIGLNLASVAVKEISASLFETLFGIFVIVAVSVYNVYLSSKLSRFSLLIGSVFCYLTYWALCNGLGFGRPIDFSLVASASLFGFPKFTTPKFDFTAITLIAPVAIVLVAENLGHVRAIGSMCHRNLDAHIGPAFVVDGLCTMVSGFFGGTGVTTYAENIGVMSMSRNFSSLTMVFAGLFALFLSLSPKFGALVQTIPVCILGGLSFILFGMITASAGRIWQDNKVDFAKPANSLVVGVALIMGAGDLTIRVGNFAFGGITTATFAIVILYQLLRWNTPTELRISPTNS